jgi:hypothetical protein
MKVSATPLQSAFSLLNGASETLDGAIYQGDVLELQQWQGMAVDVQKAIDLLRSTTFPPDAKTAVSDAKKFATSGLENLVTTYADFPALDADAAELASNDLADAAFSLHRFR